MDRFNVTNIGDPLPILGQEITEDPETLKQRKKGMKIQWNTNSVYTMALWSGKRCKFNGISCWLLVSHLHYHKFL